MMKHESRIKFLESEEKNEQNGKNLSNYLVPILY